MSSCVQSGLRQVVKQPTRGEYLLDLILTDLDKKAIALSRNITTELLSYNSFALGKTSSQLFSADALFKFEDKQTICNDCREEYRAQGRD